MRCARPIALAFAMLTGCDARAADSPLGKALEARLAVAQGGTTIRLAAGNYGAVALPKRTFRQPLTIDARQATFSSIIVDGVNNVAIIGGVITGTKSKAVGVSIRRSSGVRIEAMTIQTLHRGIVIGDSSDINIIGNTLTDLQVDGVDIALSRRVRVERNRCRNFTPMLAVYDAQGKRLRDGDHADCIQAWSRPTAPPVSDIVVIGNDIEGSMQGIFFGNHQRDGVDDGGFDRIIVKDNRVVVGAPNGIRLVDARDSVVQGNSVGTLPGSLMPNGKPIRAIINVSGLRTIACGNRVDGIDENLRRRLPATDKCP